MGITRANALVSCIVPAFNSEAYLEQALASILAQSYEPLEVVVADDGSSDSTVVVANAFDERVRVVAQPTAGPAATRNLGICEARGSFVAFLDPDDLWLPKKLEIQMSHFAARAGLQCSVTYAQAFWDESCPDEEERYRGHARMRAVPGYALTTLLARRSAFDEVGLLDESLWYADAVDWFARANDQGVALELIPDVLTRHRLHGANLTRRGAEASADEFLTVVKRRLDRRRGAVEA